MNENDTELTKRELEIMRVLWNSKKALTGREVVERSHDSTWAHSTVYAKLNRLVEKGFVREAGAVKKGKNISQTYVPSISSEQFFQGICDRLPPCVDRIGLIRRLLFLDETNIELLDKLTAILKK